MRPLEEKPFRSPDEPADETSSAHIRVGHARVRPHVVPFPERAGDLTRADFVTTFLAAWEPYPTPPAHWIELLRQAPFGSQTVRAHDLHWDGRSFSIERSKESEIEAFDVEMADWVAFANAMFGQREHTSAEEALAEARKRANELESRLRR